jgi:hypothetical protein
MASFLLQPPPVMGDVLSIPINPKLRRGYYSNMPMATKAIQVQKEVAPQIAKPSQTGEKPRLGDQNIMQILKKAVEGAVETTDSKQAMPSQLEWRR